MELRGYCYVWGDLGRPQGGSGRLHRIAEGALGRFGFGRVKMLFNHDAGGRPLASTEAGTLRLWCDARGIAFSACVDGEAGHALARLVCSGEIRQVSPGTTILASTANDSVVTVTAAQLFELSLCAESAFPQARIWLDSWAPEDMPPGLEDQALSWSAGHPDTQRPAPRPAASRRRTAPVSARPSLGATAASARIRPIRVEGLGTVYVAARRVTYFNRLLGHGIGGCRQTFIGAGFRHDF